MIAPLPPDAPVLVTGCSSGIGRATALRLVADGRPVFASARRVEQLGELRGAGCRTVELDVTDQDSMAAAVAAVASAVGPVGALVNNAGYGEYGPVEELSLAAVRRQFETNVFGPLHLTQLVLPGMRARGAGRIVNVSSMGGRMTLPGGGAYHASKYALESFSDALRFEVRGFGIGVSLVEPGPVLTAFAEEATAVAADGGAYAGFRRGVAARNASAYAGPNPRGTSSPEDVAGVIAGALQARRPRARYLVGPVSRTLVTTHALAPTPVWDALLRRQFPSPGASG